MRMLMMACLVAGAAAAVADVYRWTDESGNVVFSDTPREGAEKIEISEPSSMPAQRVPRRTTRLSPPQDEFSGYEEVRIAAPANEATVRNVQSISVQVTVRPALRSGDGHRVQLYYDGAPHGAPQAGTTFQVAGLVRGSHELSAAVLDGNGKELVRSAPSVFFVHQHSVRNP